MIKYQGMKLKIIKNKFKRNKEKLKEWGTQLKQEENGGLF
jgi:hypothetical protein